MCSVETLDKGMIPVLGGMEQDIKLLRRVHNLKRMNCLFLEFSIEYF